jgi:hypothetical protein
VTTTLQKVGKNVGRLDRTLVKWVTRLPPSAADDVFHWLSRSANQGRLWVALAGAMALRNGRARQAAAHGLIALTVASATNAAFKALLPSRLRPEHLAFLRFGHPEHGSSSLPSGIRRPQPRLPPVSPW